jgi:hypothetical protein
MCTKLANGNKAAKAKARIKHKQRQGKLPESEAFYLITLS